MSNTILTINVFKGEELFRSLIKHNSTIANIAYKADYSKGCNYFTKDNGASFWFDPSQIRQTPTSRYYPIIHPSQLDPRLCLILHIANYISILVIHTLYKDNKSVLIEDMCCGMGNMIFYLSKLGFNNFSAIDNFSQLPSYLFDDTMKAIAQSTPSFRCSLNNIECVPTIINMVAYIEFLRPLIPTSTEILMFTIPIVTGMGNLNLNVDEFYSQYCLLAHDTEQLLWIYCRKDKHQEFTEKLLPIKV